MANHNDRILRFHVADKVFHGLNAILWFALVITGAIVYLCKSEAATGESPRTLCADDQCLLDLG